MKASIKNYLPPFVMMTTDDGDDDSIVEEKLDMETFCFCTAGDEHGYDYDENYVDLGEGDVVDNNDVIVDNVEQERDLACVKLGDVLSAVARGQRKNKPNEWVNAMLHMHKLSRIGVTYTTILQQRLPTLNQRL